MDYSGLGRGIPRLYPGITSLTIRLFQIRESLRLFTSGRQQLVPFHAHLAVKRRKIVQ